LIPRASAAFRNRGGGGWGKEWGRTLPFAGKNTVADQHGDRYIPWLQVVHAGAHGNADYCAHFFRRAYDLLGANGTLGFIATNTISQGDTPSDVAASPDHPARERPGDL